MTELADIRAGLKANLDPLNEPVSWIEVSAYSFADPAIVPCIFVSGVQELDPLITFGTDKSLTLLIQAYAGTMTDRGPQMALDRLIIGAYAAVPLIVSDRTLGGLVETLEVLHMAGHREFAIGSTRVLGLEWVVQIELTV